MQASNSAPPPASPGKILYPPPLELHLSRREVDDDLADEVEAIRLAADFNSRRLLAEQRGGDGGSSSRSRIRAVLDKQRTQRVREDITKLPLVRSGLNGATKGGVIFCQNSLKTRLKYIKITSKVDNDERQIIWSCSNKLNFSWNTLPKHRHSI